MPIATQQGADVLLLVKAVPGASRDQIAGRLGDRLKVRVAAAPEGGKANAAVCTLIARALNIPASAVQVERGHSHPEKTLRITSADAAAVERTLVG